MDDCCLPLASGKLPLGIDFRPAVQACHRGDLDPGLTRRSLSARYIPWHPIRPSDLASPTLQVHGLPTASSESSRTLASLALVACSTPVIAAPVDDGVAWQHFDSAPPYLPQQSGLSCGEDDTLVRCTDGYGVDEIHQRRPDLHRTRKHQRRCDEQRRRQWHSPCGRQHASSPELDRGSPDEELSIRIYSLAPTSSADTVQEPHESRLGLRQQCLARAARNRAHIWTRGSAPKPLSLATLTKGYATFDVDNHYQCDEQQSGVRCDGCESYQHRLASALHPWPDPLFNQQFRCEPGQAAQQTSNGAVTARAAGEGCHHQKDGRLRRLSPQTSWLSTWTSQHVVGHGLREIRAGHEVESQGNLSTEPR